jgi:hypothetical protein
MLAPAMRVLLTSRAQLEFDSLAPVEQRTILEAVELEARAARRTASPSWTGPVTIRLQAPPFSVKAVFSASSVLVVSIQRLST